MRAYNGTDMPSVCYESFDSESDVLRAHLRDEIFCANTVKDCQGCPVMPCRGDIPAYLPVCLLAFAQCARIPRYSLTLIPARGTGVSTSKSELLGFIPLAQIQLLTLPQSMPNRKRD